MKKKKIFIIIACGLLVIAAGILIWHFCGHKSSENQRKYDVRERDLRAAKEYQNIHIKRYEVDLFSLDTANLAEELERIAGNYPEILIAPDVWKDPQMLYQLKAYITDPTIAQLYTDVMRTYPDFNDVEKAIGHAMGYYHTYFPDDSIPTFYSIMPGMDTEMPTVYGYGNDVFINIDMYLGSKYKFYSQIGMPLFISQLCEKKYIALDCFSKAMAYRQLSQKMPISLLDYMIYEGKRIYFTELMFPETPENDVISYTEEKYKWAVENQGQVWRYIIDKDLLFSKQSETIRQFVGEAPFTKPFSNTSPGRMGTFIGWKIVQAYMERNPEVSVSELMKESDSQTILNKSAYKPR